jgi:hypothetical protein
MATEASEAKIRVFQPFTVVDLVTIAVFAGLWRTLWYVEKLFAFLGPFDNTVGTFFYVMCAVAAMTIVRKVGTATLYTITAMLINLLVQGEAITAVLIASWMAILGDIYVGMRVAAGHDPFSSIRDMFIAGTGVSLGFQITVWLILYLIVYMVDIKPEILIAAFVACGICGMIGGLAGFKIGDRLKSLLQY